MTTRPSPIIDFKLFDTGLLPVPRELAHDLTSPRHPTLVHGFGVDAEEALECLLRNLVDAEFDLQDLESRITRDWVPTTVRGNGATTFYNLYLAFKSMDKSNYLDENELIVGRTYRCGMYDGTDEVLRFDGEGTFEDASLRGDVRFVYEEIDPAEVTKLIDDLDEAHEDEADAASRWSLYDTQLKELGVDPDDWSKKHAENT